MSEDIDKLKKESATLSQITNAASGSGIAALAATAVIAAPFLLVAGAAIASGIAASTYLRKYGLEKKIHDLEAGNLNARPEESTGESLSETTDSGGTGKLHVVTLLLNKCETLLRMDKPDEALGCLNEALTIDPDNAEALMKKGAALERLQRFTEALECYDRAIVQDGSMTMAYLYKGGVFNRMERYSEALECYEAALKTRKKGQAANVIMEGERAGVRGA